MVQMFIAGLNVDLKVFTNINADMYAFNAFLRNNNELPQLTINFSMVPELSSSGTKIYAEEGLSWWKAGKHTEVVITKAEGNLLSAILHANETWDDIHIRKNLLDKSPGILKTLGEIAFRTSILFYSGLVLHAAAIKWHDRAIVFSAPANTGKSTQAGLWEQNMGALIINGDRPALRIVEGIPIAYGTPWSGSSSDFINDSAPLTAIILLEQARENSICELSAREAAGRLAARAFLPYWDCELMNLALSNLEKILQCVPVYQLKCRPDKEAVELVRQRVEA